MKSRVAVPAALIALIALVLIPVYSSLNIAADRNASAQEALRGFCQVTGSMTEQSSEAERAGVLETLLLPAGASSALYSSDGTLVYASSEELSAPAERVFTSALERRARSVTAEDSEGAATLYAIYRYEDGAFLLFSTAQLNAAAVLGGNSGIVLILILLIAACAAARRAIGTRNGEQET